MKRTKTSVKKSLYKLQSQIIRSQHPRCIKCGIPATEVHHIFGRANLNVAWDLNNVLPVCSGCHIFSHTSFEQSPYDMVNQQIICDWLMERGTNLDDLREAANSVKKFSLDDLLNLEKELKALLANMKGNLEFS